MTSRFVSSGAIDTKTGATVPATTNTPTSTHVPGSSSGGSGSGGSSSKAQEWAEVQAQVESARSQRKGGAAGGEETTAPVVAASLYEVLQVNKAAKQAAVEESRRMRNQFRAMDEEEVAFLEEVAATRRAEEARARKDVEDGLRGFRAAQQEEGRRGLGDWGEEGEGGLVKGGWAVGRRRRKRGQDEKGRLVKGAKKRMGVRGDGQGEGKTEEGGGQAEDGAAREKAGEDTKESAVEARKALDAGDKGAAETATNTAAASKPRPGQRLVDYGSDDDSD